MLSKNMQKKIYLFFLSLIFLCGCDGQYDNKNLRIGIDPHWSTITVDGEEKFVSGFIDELLLDISKQEKVIFTKIRANWDSLLEGMNAGKYDGVISAMEPYNFNRAQYDISPIIVQTGPVLVFPVASQGVSLEDPQIRRVAISWEGDAEKLFLQYPNVTFLRYSTLAQSFNDVDQGIVDAAVTPMIPTIGYIQDIYQGKLQMSKTPLMQQGLRLITPKDKPKLQKVVQQGIKELQNEHRLIELKKKWNLAL